MSLYQSFHAMIRFLTIPRAAMPVTASAVLLLILISTTGCATSSLPADDMERQAGISDRPVDVDELRLVDCLLPGQVRKLGRRSTFLTQRRPIRTSARDCALRGGEYVEYDRANYQTALAVWLVSAESGDADAQFYVGQIYDKGLGTEPNYPKALEWYLKAANQDHRAAQTIVSYFYETGLGVEQDLETAADWLRRATGSTQKYHTESELNAIRAELNNVQSELASAQDESADLAEKLASAQNALKSERASTTKSTVKLNELESQIASLESRLAAKTDTIASLETSRQRFSLPGPSIDIFDTYRSALPTNDGPQTLAGRVTAPAGLSKFLVNNSLHQVDNDGIFRIPVDAGQEITFVAIDQQGKQRELIYEMRESAPSSQPQRESSTATITFGKYHALIIGNSDYTDLSDLQTPRNDVEAIDTVLRDRYGFTTTLLRDAKLVDVIGALNTLTKALSEDDNLLVYYAGHGQMDETGRRGYWLPVDASQDNRDKWLSTGEITDYLAAIKAKQILVIADSCYSGTLTRSSLARFDADSQDRDGWLRQVKDKRSRTAMTSGGLRPVLDAMGEDHSVFARAVIDELTNNSDILETEKLWARVRSDVVYRTQGLPEPQKPEYAPLSYGHESGEFFFVPVGS